MRPPRVIFSRSSSRPVGLLLITIIGLVLLGACGSTDVVEPVFEQSAPAEAQETSILAEAAESRAVEYVEPNILDRAEILEWYRDTEGLEPQAAQCMADESLNILGAYNVALPTPEELDVIDELRPLCVGESLALDGDQPPPGTNPALDDLWVRCGGGDMAACDQLFDDSPAGSRYEAFGATCGGGDTPALLCDGDATFVDPVIRSAAIAGRVDAGLSTFEAECVTDGYIAIVGDPSPLPGATSAEQDAELDLVAQFCADEAALLSEPAEPDGTDPAGTTETDTENDSENDAESDG